MIINIFFLLEYMKKFFRILKQLIEFLIILIVKINLLKFKKLKII